MTVFDFLAALPAILGVMGFVIYLLLKDRAKEPLLDRIVEKLRVEVPDRLGSHVKRLTPSELARTIKGDQKLRQFVGEQDFLLLEQLLRHRFVLALAVYLICAGMDERCSPRPTIAQYLPIAIIAE